MAISHNEYKLIHDLKMANLFPKKPHVVELGESNWYGDVSLEQLGSDIDRFVLDPDLKTQLRAQLAECAAALECSKPKYSALWEIVRIFLQTFLDYETLTPIDIGGTDRALRLDLNQPLELDRQFDLALNFGTAEHIFNVYQVFKTVHEITRPGCLMIHGLPFHGWVDHGFFNFHPTFYLDLAATNGYEVMAMIYASGNSPELVQISSREQIIDMTKNNQIAGNCMLYTVLRKSSQESPFITPMQGYYAGTVSEKAKEAWKSLR